MTTPARAPNLTPTDGTATATDRHMPHSVMRDRERAARVRPSTTRDPRRTGRPRHQALGRHRQHESSPARGAREAVQVPPADHRGHAQPEQPGEDRGLRWISVRRAARDPLLRHDDRSLRPRDRKPLHLHRRELRRQRSRRRVTDGGHGRRPGATEPRSVRPRSRSPRAHALRHSDRCVLPDPRSRRRVRRRARVARLRAVR